MDTSKSLRFSQEMGRSRHTPVGASERNRKRPLRIILDLNRDGLTEARPLQLAFLKPERQPNPNQPMEAARYQLLAIVGDRALLVQQVSQINDRSPLSGYEAKAG